MCCADSHSGDLARAAVSFPFLLVDHTRRARPIGDLLGEENVLPPPLAIWMRARGRSAARDFSRLRIAVICAGRRP
jgi:hypothetical protein